MTISIFGHRHPLMWVDQSESWFPAKHAHVRRHQTQHILCQQRLSYLQSTSNYFLVVAWFFYFFIEKADFFSKIQTFWRKRRPYLCVFFKKVLFADQSPLKRTQLVSLGTGLRCYVFRWSLDYNPLVRANDINCLWIYSSNGDQLKS